MRPFEVVDICKVIKISLNSNYGIKCYRIVRNNKKRGGLSLYKVSDLLKHLEQTTIYYIAPELSITDAKNYLKEKRIGAVSVKTDDELVGILTERDILWKCDLRDDLSLVKVESIMTPVEDIVTVNPAVNLEECFNLMDVHRIRHLPVVEERKLVGMISIRDLVRAIVDQQFFISSQLENYLTGRS